MNSISSACIGGFILNLSNPRNPRMFFGSGDMSIEVTRAKGAAALLLLAVLLYVNSLGGGFVWDDELNYLDNPVIFTQTVRSAFTSDIYHYSANKEGLKYYRPLHVLGYSWLARITNLNPFALHLFSVMFHAGAGILAFLLLAEFLELRLAWLAAALFLAHPLHVEAVAWMASVSEVATAVLMLLSLYSLLLAERSARWWLALSYAAAVLAFLTKETALVLPLMATFFVGRRAWPFLALATGAVGLRLAMIGLGGGAVPPRGVVRHTVVILRAGALYFRKLVWPWPLATDYDYHQPVLVWVVFAVALGLAAWGAWKSQRVRLGLMLLVVPLLPALGGSLALPSLHLAQDRYAYLAVLGFALLVASLVRYRRGLAACLGVLAVWAVLTQAAIPHWRDEEALWSNTLRVTPQSKNAVLGLGSWYYTTGRFAEAEELYVSALKRFPNDPKITQSLESVRRTRARGH